MVKFRTFWLENHSIQCLSPKGRGQGEGEPPAPWIQKCSSARFLCPIRQIDCQTIRSAHGDLFQLVPATNEESAMPTFLFPYGDFPVTFVSLVYCDPRTENIEIAPDTELSIVLRSGVIISLICKLCVTHRLRIFPLTLLHACRSMRSIPTKSWNEQENEESDVKN